MRLKKMTLQGFKSFADKTVLHFNEGITCIVGPNGCGKSNIADAFRWVLGEQSAKSMRGGKMLDLIFAGTKDRKPLNIAEVSFSLSDIQGALPIEYEEITITRRLHRSGESLYFLNGNPIRLKDLHQLFLGSGIGKNAFSFFEQGKLDHIISSTPQERRTIFEEASGILRFIERKKEAVKKLQLAELNLERIQDIYREVERNIQTLEIQAKKALHYKQQREKFELLEKTSYFFQYRSLEQKKADYGKKSQELQFLYAKKQQASENKFTLFQELQERFATQELACREKKECLVKQRSHLEVCAKEKELYQQRGKEIYFREKKLKQELEERLLAKRECQEIKRKLNDQCALLDLSWSEAETVWSQAQEAFKIQETQVKNLRQTLQIQEKNYLKVLQESNEKQSRLNQLGLRLENIEEKQAFLEASLKQLKSEEESLHLSLKEKKENVRAISAIIETHKERLDECEEQIQAIAIKKAKHQKEIEEFTRKIAQLQARQKVLLQMREELEGFSSGSKKLLQEAQNEHSPFYQQIRPLYEFFEVQEEAAQAVAGTLRLYADTLVVQSVQQAQAVLAFARERNLQDYSLLCLEWLKQPLSESRKETNLAQKVVPSALTDHFLKDVTLFVSSEEALAAWNRGECAEAWSAEGYFLDAKGVFFHLNLSENQVFMRESELKLLEELLTEQENELAQIRALLAVESDRQESLQFERSECDRRQRKEEMRLVEANFAVHRLLSDLDKNQKEREKFHQEALSLGKQKEELSLSFSHLKEETEQALETTASIQNEKEQLAVQLKKEEEQLHEEERARQERGLHYQELKESRGQLLNEHRLIENKENEHEKRQVEIEESLELLLEQMAETKQEEQALEEEIKRCSEMLRQQQEELKESEERTFLVKKEKEELEAALTALREHLREIELDLKQAEMQFAHQEELLQKLKRELFEHYQTDVEKVQEEALLLTLSFDQVEKQIKELRKVLQDNQEVNFSAIEDLEKQTQRFSFLKQQLTDVQQSKEELLFLIQELEAESRQLFKGTFEAIRANFQKNFQILFSGGEAELQLTDSKDLLEAGIEIIAKPPGKQMSAITLLSGGEKCLTAVALLFAIFEVRPSPFCLLDEIDAPLDDTNVERFLNVVKHFAPSCQFLIITHNKRTMAACDSIFGVSMEEKGVSKLLSLAFNHKNSSYAEVVSVKE